MKTMKIIELVLAEIVFAIAAIMLAVYTGSWIFDNIGCMWEEDWYSMIGLLVITGIPLDWFMRTRNKLKKVLAEE